MEYAPLYPEGLLLVGFIEVSGFDPPRPAGPLDQQGQRSFVFAGKLPSPLCQKKRPPEPPYAWIRPESIAIPEKISGDQVKTLAFPCFLVYDSSRA